MIKYKIVKNGVVTNQWTSDFAGADYYESCFGLPERPELDEQGNPTGNILPAEYQLVSEDITAQLAQEQTNETARKYLADTDWYIIREMDNGVPCPTDIKQARATARASIQ